MNDDLSTSSFIPATGEAFAPPSSLLVQLPSAPITVRVATREDVPFVDALQKANSKSLGFFPRAQMEGYIDAGNMLVAAEVGTGERVGYVASKDRYLKRDELGAVFQLCVAPGKQRSFIGANLLREVFERSAYGCKLFCCWCAQDLSANKFWEAMGFVPIAYRAGSEKKSRVHIYWQKRIRAGDVTTPYWFPAKTEGGAIREDRIILPIPPGMRWTDDLPVLKTDSTPKEPAKKSRMAAPAKPQPVAPARQVIQWRTPGMARKSSSAPLPTPTPPPVETLPAKAEKPKVKCDPLLIAQARELRDRWMEHVAANGIEHDVVSQGKYALLSVERPARAIGTILDEQRKSLPPLPLANAA